MGNYNIWFDIAGIAILAVIFLMSRLKHTFPSTQTKIFKVVFLLCCLATLSDLLFGLWLNNIPQVHEVFPLWVFSIINYVYFFSHTSTAFLFFMYASLTLNLKNNYTRLLLIPLIGTYLLLLSNPLTHTIFTIDSEGYYRGPLILVVYLLCAFYLFIGAMLLFKYGGTLGQGKKFSLLFLVFFFALGVTVQGLFPLYLVENYCSDVCILLVYLSLHRPEEAIDTQTKLLNSSSFSSLTRLMIGEKHRFSLIYIHIVDGGYIRESLGTTLVDNLRIELANYLIKNFKKAYLFCLEEWKFCLIYNDKEQMVDEQALSHIVKRFNLGWNIQEQEVIVTPVIAVINFPQHARSQSELSDIIEAVNDLPARPDKRVVKISELNVQRQHWYKEIDRISRTCVDDNLLEVVFQPVFDIKKQCFSSAEALVRLKDPLLGQIPPEELISIAEKNGNIIQIDNYILNDVCGFISQNHLGLESLNVNISIVECMQCNMIQKLTNTLNAFCINPNFLHLEITETASGSFPLVLDENIRRLSEKGFVFCLDDFGSGYSNLDRLISLPFSIIKLDKPFITMATESFQTLSYLYNTIKMIKNLGRKILVEGVETEQQANMVANLGCDYIQGYYYSKPLNKVDFLKFLETQCK
ncbi:MAG: EAL domain-containing protein [Sphaerochaetaceae bacterium]